MSLVKDNNDRTSRTYMAYGLRRFETGESGGGCGSMRCNKAGLGRNSSHASIRKNSAKASIVSRLAPVSVYGLIIRLTVLALTPEPFSSSVGEMPTANPLEYVSIKCLTFAARANLAVLGLPPKPFTAIGKPYSKLSSDRKVLDMGQESPEYPVCAGI